MPFLYARQNPLDDARNTFSSWDNCMAKAYCKWPVIIGIVVGGLIAFSVIFCIARCLCCAAECTICCCKCCTCCCPSGSSGSGHKRMKSEPTYPPYAPNPHAANPYNANPYAQAHVAAPPAPLNQQYRSHAAPAFAPAPTYAHVQERPQFATFDSPSKPANEDALPAMPSWGDARDRHVEVEEQPVPEKRGDMEMDRLNHNGSVTNTSMAGMAAVPRRSPVPTRSPVSPVDGYGYNQGFENEPLVGAAPHRSPHASPAPYSNARPYVQQDDYRRGSPAQNLSPVYGAGEGYARNQSYDRHSPAPQQQPHDPYDHYDQHDAQSGYASIPPSYHTSPPPPAQSYNNAPYDNFAPAPARQRTPSPEYSYPPEPARTPEPIAQPVSAYPGQRSYTPQAQNSYPGQPTYQAFNPGQTGPQTTGVARKAVDGTYREI
ncbi:hypothetical protein HBI12_105900 [Parastagonospora nodorum]|nr:hypothetical protein HBI12_105900 [Parastagonospora nodorum]